MKRLSQVVLGLVLVIVLAVLVVAACQPELAPAGIPSASTDVPGVLPWMEMSTPVVTPTPASAPPQRPSTGH